MTDLDAFNFDDKDTSNSYTMASMVESFPASSFAFDLNGDFPPYSFDAQNQRPPVSDPSIMWGGMSQMSLDRPDVQKWMDNANALQNNPYGQPANHINQHGQITPPNDNDDDAEPSSSKARQQGNSLEEEEQSTSRRGSGRSKRTSTTKRKSKTEEPDEAPVKQHQKKTTRKARKGYKATTVEEEEDSDGEVKRERFLERNRVAASKCRQKKKEWTNGLEGQARDLAAQNAQLHAYALQLRDEVLHLKGECLRHVDCDCIRIREYLDRSIAGMNPSGALNGVPQPYRKPSDQSAYTFNSSTTGTGESRQGLLALESDRGGGGMSVTSDQEMQALLEASINSPASVASPASTSMVQ